jgi:hypothetical protein
MSQFIATYGFEYGFAGFVLAVLLFNILYFFVILPMLTERSFKLEGDIFFAFRQYRYVRAYLGLLPQAQRHRWYNVFIRYSFVVALAFWLVCMGSLAISWRQ